jgi:CheY-like chemotaxis protein
MLAFPTMARERILLIEDEPDIAEVLQYNLEKEGFQVELAGRGNAGLEAVRRESPGRRGGAFALDLDADVRVLPAEALGPQSSGC